MQIEILLKQKQEQNSGFRRAACTRTGAALTSASVVCLVAVRSAIALCSTRTLARTLIASVCAQSCRFLNSENSTEGACQELCKFDSFKLNE